MSTPKYTWTQIENKIREIVSDELSTDLDKVRLESRFIDDLGADSLDTVELMIRVEEEFGIQINDEDADRMISLAEGIRLYVEKNPREVLRVVDTKILSFRLRADGTIEVSLQLEDGSWTYADGKTLLPSRLYLITLSKWGNILRDLEDLINNPKTKEADLQKFFEEYPELIAGDDYDTVIPQATISRDDCSPWKADFVLAPVNQTEFSRIVELKIPGLPLTKRPHSGHFSFSAKLWNALSQLRDYERAFDREQVRENFRNNYGVDVYKPDLHLIAGRRWNFAWMDNIRELQRTTPVKIEDWDSVLDRLKRRYK